MAFKVVLDANVLYPFSLRDTLLRLAERELYVDLCEAESVIGPHAPGEDRRPPDASGARCFLLWRSRSRKHGPRRSLHQPHRDNTPASLLPSAPHPSHPAPSTAATARDTSPPRP